MNRLDWLTKMETSSKLHKKIRVSGAMHEAMEDINNPFVICLFDVMTYEFIYVSRNIERITGFTPQEMDGRNFSFFLSDEGKKLFGKASIEAVDENREEGKVIDSFNTIYKHKDGIHEVLIKWWASSASSKTGHSYCHAIHIETRVIQK